MDTLMEVERSISESSENPTVQGTQTPAGTTAFEISRMEQNAATVLGLFIKMISQYVRQYGRLRLGDIIQYLTIVDADKITDDAELVYKSFIVKGSNKYSHKKIEFTNYVPEKPIDGKTHLKHSYDILKQQKETNMEIHKVNPTLFRELAFTLVITPDVLRPKSDDLERAQKLELFDRAIQMGPALDQEKVAKDFLLGAYKDIKDPEEYIAKQPQGGGQMGTQGTMPQPNPMGSQPNPMKGMGQPQIPNLSALNVK
jgi:hypothetical protein